MASRGGRSQRIPMERLVRMAAALQRRPELGIEGDVLARIAGFDGNDKGTQVQRELRHLERQGWRIENVAAPGEPAVYRMRTVDNRLRVRLTPAQQTALRRAVLLARRSDLVERLGLPAPEPGPVSPEPAAAQLQVDPDLLGSVVDAVRSRRVLRFAYKGTPRVVHPESVRNQNGTWYLRGVEDGDLERRDAHGSHQVKAFVVSRMSDPVSDRPGSAAPVAAVRHAGLHPMTWEIDPPVEVVLETALDFEDDVRRWLGEPVEREPVDDADLVRLRYRVTHRAALRARLNELGRRVRVVGPAEVRAEVVAALAAAAGITTAEEVEG